MATCQVWRHLALLGVLLMAAVSQAETPPAAPALDAAPRVFTVPVAGTPGLPLYWFAPVTPASAPRPLLVWIHGGGWSQGAPELMFYHARWAASRGAIGVVLSYRLANRETRGLAECLADVRAGLAWLRAQAAEHGGDPKRLTLLGESAGGHLAAAAVILPWPAPTPAPPAAEMPAALVLLNPVLDLRALTWRPTAREFTGLPAGPLALDGPGGQWSPSEFVRAGLPPSLILHGAADPVVPVASARQFAAAMKAAGNACDFQELAETKHAFAIPGYGTPEQVKAALDAVDRFLTARALLPPAP